MKERPILFNSAMVRAILEGRKTQTRRIRGLEDVNKLSNAWDRHVLGKLGYMTKKSAVGKFGATFTSHPGAIENKTISICPQIFPFGKVGDRLWVRETWNITFKSQLAPGENIAKSPDHCFADNGGFNCACGDGVVYAADGILEHPQYGKSIWKPSIHMPRWASRILLEITNIGLERLNDVSEEDAIAEGLKAITKDGKTIKYGMPDTDGYPGTDNFGWPWHEWNVSPVIAYKKLWESINGPGSWDINPWVWVIEFKRTGE